MNTRTIFSRLAFLFLAAALLAGCKERKKGSGSAYAGDLYFDYQVSGEEGDDSLTCRLQYKWGGSEGETAMLEAPAQVSLDGEPLAADSAGFSGIYYEIRKPLAGFGGTHTLLLADAAKRQYRDTFRFPTFGVKELPAQVKRGDLVLHLTGFTASSRRLHVLLVDTAWATNDLNMFLPVEDSALHISGGRLAELKAGPVSLELRCEESWPLRQTTKAGGRLRLNYGLRRSFDLVN